MNFTKHTTGLAAALALFLSAAASTPSHGAVTITAVESGGNVVFTYSGSINLSGLGFANSATIVSRIIASTPEFASAGSSGGNSDEYVTPISGPAFGDGFLYNPDSSSGSAFVFNTFSTLRLPVDYTGGALSGSMTFNNKTFATLGLTPGSYLYQINGSSTNTITMNIDSVPEPSRLLLAGLGICGLLLRRRRVRAV